MLALAVIGVREPEQGDPPRSSEGIGTELRGALRSPAVVSVGLFTALWNFNPLSNPILHLHMTGALGLSQQTFGNALSLFSVTSLAAAMAYGFYCSAVRMSVLVHVTVVLGIVANLAYAAIVDEPSAGFATAAVGFAYMTATLIQFDLAARACPPGAAGTIFASLMAVANLSTLVSTWLGGLAYERLGAAWGHTTAFRILIGLSALFTTGCWLIVPRIPRSILSNQPAVGSKSD
jgi:predicted MFS family arabinose efflux permease